MCCCDTPFCRFQLNLSYVFGFVFPLAMHRNGWPSAYIKKCIFIINCIDLRVVQKCLMAFQIWTHLDRCSPFQRWTGYQILSFSWVGRLGRGPLARSGNVFSVLPTLLNFSWVKTFMGLALTLRRKAIVGWFSRGVGA